MTAALVTLVWVMIAVGILWCGAVVAGMALTILRPPRMTDARALLELGRLSPADLGLQFEDVSFQVRDEQNGKKLKIAAWWMPNPTAHGRCAVIVHGYGDAKVGGIAWAPLLQSMGFAVLAIDLRAHGESGGLYCSAAYWERHDLNQIIDQFRAAQPQAMRQVVLFGISLGAAVVAAAAIARNDIAAVILECPYADFQRAAAYQADRLGAPGISLQHLSFRLAQWLARCDFAAVRPARTIAQIPCPVMVIQSGDDPFLSEEDRQTVRQAVESRPSEHDPSTFWELQGVRHVVGMCDDPAEYRRRMEKFLSAALPKTVGVCEK